MQYSIVNLSEVRENSDFRIDAEFYHPFYIKKYLKINSIQHIKFKEIILSIKNGDDFREYIENGKKYIRTGDFNFYGLNLSSCVKVKENLHSKIKLHCGDLLITRKGNYGKVDIVNNDNRDCFISSEIFHIILKNNIINPYFLKIYLNSIYGFSFIERYIHGISNFSITQESLKEILVPIFSQNFQSSIAELVNKSYTLRQSADTLYKEAEDILLEELGFKDYQIKNQKCFVKNLSDTQKVSRIDAEYFQPKYEDLINKIKEYKGGYSSLDNIANIKSGSLVPDDLYSNDKSGIPYIRVKDLNFKGEINKENIVYLKNFTNTNETIAYTGDYIIATIGTVGKVGIVDNKLNGCIPSNNTSKISLKNKQNELFYLLLFQSFIFQQQIEKEFTQTAQPKILDNQLCNIIIPLLPESIQSTISSKLHKSFLDRQKSLDLLAVAKGAVEVAVEDGEDVAFGYIDNNL